MDHILQGPPPKLSFNTTPIPRYNRNSAFLGRRQEVSRKAAGESHSRPGRLSRHCPGAMHDLICSRRFCTPASPRQVGQPAAVWRLLSGEWHVDTDEGVPRKRKGCYHF